jgi:hypothetical protein
LLAPVVLRAGKRGENDAVDDLENLERKAEAGRSWNLDFKFAATNSGEIGKNSTVCDFWKNGEGLMGGII